VKVWADASEAATANAVTTLGSILAVDYYWTFGSK